MEFSACTRFAAVGLLSVSLKLAPKLASRTFVPLGPSEAGNRRVEPLDLVRRRCDVVRSILLCSVGQVVVRGAVNRQRGPSEVRATYVATNGDVISMFVASRFFSRAEAACSVTLGREFRCNAEVTHNSNQGGNNTVAQFIVTP
jgi:hypothetical protein